MSNLVSVNSAGKYVCRDNIIRSSCAKLVRAANLSAPIPVEIAVSDDTDGPFSPTTHILENGVDLILLPGTYRLGFNCADYVGVAPENPVFICCEDVDVQEALAIQSNAKLCALLGAVAEVTAVESSFAQVGCIKEAGVQIGVVMGCKKADSAGVVQGIELWAFIPGQPPIQAYDGPWEVCAGQDPSSASLLECLQEIKNHVALFNDFLNQDC